MYRIQYIESGNNCLTGAMPLTDARKIVATGKYDEAEIVPDEEYAICKHCMRRNQCRDYNPKYPHDSCGWWKDYAI